MNPHKNFIIIGKNINHDKSEIYTTLLLDENENILEELKTSNKDDMLNAVSSFEKKYNLHDETVLEITMDCGDGEKLTYHKLMYEFIHEFIVYNYL